MKTSLIILFVFSFSVLKSQNSLYDISLIDDSLKEHSNVVIRYDSISYKLISPGKAVMKRNRVVTVLNQHGDDFSEVYVVYDKHSKVNSFSGEILDEKGEKIRKIKKNEITDNSLVSNYTLFQDDRYLSFEALNHSYPYTINSEYEITYNGLVSINRWMPVPDYNVSVEKARFTIVSENHQDINLKAVNFSNNYRKSVEDSRTVYEWKLDGQKAFEKEQYSQSRAYNFPVLWSTPVNFEYDGTKGSFNSWKTFGEWEWNLVNGKQELTEKTKNEIQDLIKDLKSDKEKARELYKYLQSKTRYVSVQLGIGGWEPFSASVVDNVGYGDCKALSNYMVSLLKYAGIESYYSVIGSGSTRINFPEFPSMGQANHVITCVPLESDTVWLECTNQEYPFGYIGLGNDDRYTLLITKEGGKLVKTPKNGKDKNLQIRHARINLNQQGDAFVNVKTSYSGLQFSNRNFLFGESDEEQKKWYLNHLSFNSPVLNSFSLEKSESDSIKLVETLDILVPKYSIISGDRMFITPNLLNSFSRPQENTKQRKFNFEINFEYTDIDTIVFEVPQGYVFESIFENKNLATKFGNYNVELKIIDNRLIYIRKLEMNKGIWPPEEYDDFHLFFSEIWKTDQSKVVIVKT